MIYDWSGREFWNFIASPHNFYLQIVYPTRHMLICYMPGTFNIKAPNLNNNALCHPQRWWENEILPAWLLIDKSIPSLQMLSPCTTLLLISVIKYKLLPYCHWLCMESWFMNKCCKISYWNAPGKFSAIECFHEMTYSWPWNDLKSLDDDVCTAAGFAKDVLGHSSSLCVWKKNPRICNIYMSWAINITFASNSINFTAVYTLPSPLLHYIVEWVAEGTLLLAQIYH